MNQNQNTVQPSWVARCVMKKSRNFVYRFRVVAENEEAARLAALPKVPDSFVLESIEPERDSAFTVDLTDLPRI
jgi:hypothetical protein